MGNYYTELSYANGGRPGASGRSLLTSPGSRGVPWVRVGTPLDPGGSSRYPSVTRLCVHDRSISAVAIHTRRRGLRRFNAIDPLGSEGYGPRGPYWTRAGPGPETGRTTTDQTRSLVCVALWFTSIQCIHPFLFRGQETQWTLLDQDWTRTRTRDEEEEEDHGSDP